MSTLRELEAAATPGPWRERGRDVDHDRMVAEGRNPGDSVGLGCEIDGPPEAWVRGQFGEHADAALIVAARNALPLLLDVVDAARPYAEYVEGFSTETGLPSLKAALARLDSEPLP